MRQRIRLEVRPIEEGAGVMFVGVIQGNTLLQVGAGRAQRSTVRQGRPQSIVGSHEDVQVVDALR